MKEANQYYEMVSVKNGGFPDKEGSYKTNRATQYYFNPNELEVYKKLWKDAGIEHYLKPVTGILLQQHEYEGLMKCVAVLKYIDETNGDSKNSEVYIGGSAAAKIEQALSKLPETIK